MLRFIFIRFSLALFALFPFIIGLSAYILIRYIFAFNYYYYWEYFFYRKRTHKHKGNVIDSIRNMKGIIVIFALSLLIPFPLFCMFGLQSPPPPHLWIFCTPIYFLHEICFLWFNMQAIANYIVQIRGNAKKPHPIRTTFFHIYVYVAYQ